MAHLVTGATGFVGSALVLELLRQDDSDIIALVRPGTVDARERFHKTLEKVARLYDAADILSELPRCHAIEGDVTEKSCGISAIRKIPPISQVWHSAASLKYEDRYLDDIRCININGTKNVLELSELLGVEFFNYISTAYVSGRSNGLILEKSLTNVVSNNHYEKSKIDAEALVGKSLLKTRIFRPSIVVGHSRTLGAINFSGYYGFVRQSRQFRGLIDRTQKGLLDRVPLKLRADSDGHLNLVSVDAVAYEAVSIGKTNMQGVFHLTHPMPPGVGESINSVYEIVGLGKPIFTGDHSEFSWLDRQFDKRLDFYGSYIIGDKKFDRTRTERAMVEAGHAFFQHKSIPLKPMTQMYLDMLDQERASLPLAR